MDLIKKVRKEVKAHHSSEKTVYESEDVKKPSNPQFPVFPRLSLSNKFDFLLKDSGKAVVDLESFRVRPDVDAIYYIPDFISTSDETNFWKQIHCDAAKWTELTSRRLQRFCLNVKKDGKTDSGFPDYIQQLAEAFVKVGIFKADKSDFPNHVLLNEYIPGQGIMHHTDGEKYEPLVAAISLNSPSVLTFVERQSTDEIGFKKPRVVSRLLLEPRSVVVFKNWVYENAMHGLDGVEEEKCGHIDNLKLVSDGMNKNTIIKRGVRVSITFRREKEGCGHSVPVAGMGTK